MNGKQILINGTRHTYYEVPNPGKPPMLLLHGMMVESHCFEKLAELLGAHYHLYLLDLKGHGRSEDGGLYEESYHNDAIADDLRTFQQVVIGAPCYVLGYSLGGQYAIKFAGTHPEAVLGLVLVDSAPTLSLRGILAILYAFATTPRFFKDKEHVVRHYNRRQPGLGEYMLRHCVAESASGRYVLRYDKKKLAPPTLSQASERSRDLFEATRRITAPTLVLRAEKSVILNRRLEKKLQECMPHARFVLMREMGHNLVFTHPQALFETIRGYFAAPATA